MRNYIQGLAILCGKICKYYQNPSRSTTINTALAAVDPALPAAFTAACSVLLRVAQMKNLEIP